MVASAAHAEMNTLLSIIDLSTIQLRSRKKFYHQLVQIDIKLKYSSDISRNYVGVYYYIVILDINDIQTLYI